MHGTQVPVLFTEGPNYKPELSTSHSSESHTSYPTSRHTTDTSCGSSASEGAKERLTQLAPDGERCLLTRQPYSLECSHLVARNTRDPIRMRLASVWGMNNREFYIHDTSSMLWLDRTMHVSFDDYNWALLPTEEDLEAVVAFDDSRAGNLRAPSHYLQDGLLRSEQTLPNRIWNYHLVLFRPQHTMILRLGTNPGSYVVHQYPFETLGLLQSHVHPLYVVYNVGKKVHDILDPVWNVKSDYKLPQQHITSLHKCEALCRSWLGPLLKISESHPDQSYSDCSCLSSTSGSQSNSRSQREASNERFQRRNKTSAAQNPLPLDLSAGAGAGAGTSVALTSDQYLPIPESMPSVDCERRLETISSETSFSSLHWANPDDWAAGVESSVREDPHSGGTERARKALVEYSRDSEVARVAPQGPWEEWTPAYDFF
ncbi:unnamed protein product [Rhizoctonia solani]|uniref:HNH nuclease domain-containing protein n=1 Tax=Rhizoctonia solani TaxID=456999 RepID=A0A8H3C4P8_9AGAM|nr:unnamed protein product [Rhizoctonia solani]